MAFGAAFDENGFNIAFEIHGRRLGNGRQENAGAHGEEKDQ